jgi:hypothetical protein
MQSNQLDAGIKERVEKAISKLGFRVTVGQVAAAAGVKLSEAEQALKALAYDSLGNLEVRGHMGGGRECVEGHMVKAQGRGEGEECVVRVLTTLKG